MGAYNYAYSYASPVLGNNGYQYELVIPAAVTPISVAEAKQQVGIPASVTTHDNLLEIYIKAATAFAEKYTRREFINKTFKTFRVAFPWDSQYCGFEIKKSRSHTINSISYINRSNVTVVIDSGVYFLPFSNVYPTITLNQDQTWPSNNDVLDRDQAIVVEFIAGYGDDPEDVPEDLRTALLNHVAALFANRGDCDDCTCSSTLPSETKLVYGIYKIIDLCF